MLTERERQVLDRMVAGQSSKEIGNELGISHRTVEVHRRHLMEKFNAKNAIDLVRKVLTREAAPLPSGP